jgi:peptidoglycan/xylan/chitin deacetylase (PgdA/CDA1 family)
MSMDEQTTAVSDRVRAAPRPGPGARRSLEPHHRRRRALALVVLAAIALIAGISAGSGGGGVAHRHAGGPTGFFERVRVLAGNGESSFAAREQTAENAAIDRTLAYTPYVAIAGAQHPEIALTFDDGPGPFTPRILSVLESSNVSATFFQVGSLQHYFHDATTQILARGYPIGDHTQTHAPMSKLPRKEQQAQLLQQASAIGDYGAPFPRMFRPPYRLYDNTTLSLLQSYKMLMVLWSVDTEDYKRPGVQAIVNAAVSGARPGAIILMHDAGGPREQTVQALPQIISALRAKGYQLVTVPRLLLDNPAPANQQLTGTAGGGG